jgi:hypothetical protein
MAKILSPITAIASGIVSMLNASPIKSSLPRSDALQVTTTQTLSLETQTIYDCSNSITYGK